MSFQQGLSGLNAAAKNLDVIGNNVANTSTVGYKQSRAEFADFYAASLSGAGASNVGLGTQVAAVTQQFTQGNITASSNPMDVAINGQGFFRMSQNGAISYTRNGQFQVDKNNFIVNASGLQLTGFGLNATGVLDTSISVPLKLSTVDQNPVRTGGSTTATNTGVIAKVNLDARNATIYDAVTNTVMDAAVNSVNTAAGLVPDPPTPNTAAQMLLDVRTAVYAAATLVAATPAAAKAAATAAAIAADTEATSAAGLAGATTASVKLAATTSTAATLAATGAVGVDFNYQDPTTYNKATSLAVYDEQGNPYSQTLFFKKTDTNTWAVYSTLTNAQGVTTPLPPPAAQTLLTTLTFNSAGTLASGGDNIIATMPGAPFNLSVTPPAILPNSVGFTYPFSFAGTSQYGASFSINTLSQDGYASGKLSGTSISSDGLIKGRYTNGQTKTLGQVTVSNFQNPQGLQPMGNNQWQETAASGSPIGVTGGVPGTGSLGVLQASATEDSNVDLTAELVNMITAQRVYQANAQTIKTQDAVMQTLVNLR